MGSHWSPRAVVFGVGTSRRHVVRRKSRQGENQRCVVADFAVWGSCVLTWLAHEQVKECGGWNSSTSGVAQCVVSAGYSRCTCGLCVHVLRFCVHTKSISPSVIVYLTRCVWGGVWASFVALSLCSSAPDPMCGMSMSPSVIACLTYRVWGCVCLDVLEAEGEGAFVLRDSSSNPGCFAFSYLAGDKVQHKLIEEDDGGFYFRVLCFIWGRCPLCGCIPHDRQSAHRHVWGTGFVRGTFSYLISNVKRSY